MTPKGPQGMLSGSTSLAPERESLVPGGEQLESSCAVRSPAEGREEARLCLRGASGSETWQVVGALAYGGASFPGPHLVIILLIWAVTSEAGSSEGPGAGT